MNSLQGYSVLLLQASPTGSKYNTYHDYRYKGDIV
jgi:hypothetical protein